MAEFRRMECRVKDFYQGQNICESSDLCWRLVEEGGTHRAF